VEKDLSGKEKTRLKTLATLRLSLLYWGRARVRFVILGLVLQRIMTEH
jgi:hypothetical protein